MNIDGQRQTIPATNNYYLVGRALAHSSINTYNTNTSTPTSWLCKPILFNIIFLIQMLAVIWQYHPFKHQINNRTSIFLIYFQKFKKPRNRGFFLTRKSE
ncbi:hypothetical protein B9G39_20300 [Zooshikella ganghwensis]|uniref:Uncharacterized protein n=1 Tax=Zooshikella ganghwensis TaxID=202772 RepID=A0A4P9VQ30_9GAMM|nr:hypothetical protein B9G39_20300 [Zooshikella ganghwensis]